MKARKQIIALAALFAAGLFSTQAQVVITEVDANGSSASYGADWFEVLNIGSTTLSLNTWKMDDSSALFGSAVAMRSATSLAPGQLEIFLEGKADGSTDSAISTAFQAAWGSNLTLGFYGGSGVGLSGGGDAVNLFDSGGNVMANVTFGTSTLGQTFDNAAGLNNAALTQISQVGVDGAFASGDPTPEIGSPGVVPEPSSLALFATGATLLGMIYRRRK
jgi:Lamin Tail Domain/PEP-CTERM motif